MSLRSSLRSALLWLRTLVQNLYFWGGMGVLLLLGIGVYVTVDSIIMPAYTRHDVSVTVPNVEGTPYEKAQKQLRQLDLAVQRQVGRFNPNVERGVVVDQNPLPSTSVKPGRRVYLTVNAGEVPSVMVPDLNGLSVRQAKNRITSLQLQVGAVQADPIPAPYPNTITKQEPTPGDSLKQGEPVDLWYSTGRGTEEVTVPRVVGQTVAAARDQLLNQKLRFVMVSEGDATTEDEGTEGASSSEPNLNALYVQRQEPSSGATVRAGREIRLITTSDSTTVPSAPDPSADTTASDTSGLGF